MCVRVCVCGGGGGGGDEGDEGGGEGCGGDGVQCMCTRIMQKQNHV